MQPVKSSHLHLQKMHSPWEGHHIDGQLAQISIELSREPQTGRDARHGERHQVVQVPVGWVRQLQGAEADIVERLVIDAECLVRVLHQLVHGEGGIVRLHHSVGNFGARDDAVRVHNAVRELLSDLGYQQSAHS